MPTAKSPYADVSEIRDLFAHDSAEWKPIRDEGAKDMRYVSGDPWDPKDRDKREKAGRLCLSLDELGQYVNQVINEVRGNKRAVKFSPVGNGANDDTAQFYADKMREIEYRSRAQIGYTTAFENAVQRSYGFVRVNARYAHPRSANQDLWIDPVPNPELVTPDAEALMPDLSDQRHCWVREAWSSLEFDRTWKKHKVGGKINDLRGVAKDWVKETQNGTRVFVSEYWKVKTKRRKLLVVRPPAATQGEPPPEPIGIFEDELDGPLGADEILTTRDVDDPTVCQYLTNGIDILDEKDWPGKYIPIIGCLGKVIYVDEGGGAKRKILSMVRLARDPYMLYCYYRTCEAELVGMTPKFPYFTYDGQLAPDQFVLLQKSLHEPVAVVKVKPVTEGLSPGTVLPFPQRQPYEPPIQALEVGAESARRAIQAAMGQTPLPTAAQRRTEKSGVALQRIEELGQRGSFHFTDHYLDMITQVGVVAEDLMDKIYDSERSVGIRKENDDKAEMVRINDPADPKSISTKGDHLVTVSTGPSYDSQREAANDFADVLAQQPEIFSVLGPLVVKLKNLGPIGDEMAELLEAIQPPQVQAVKASKAQGSNDPAAARAQLFQLRRQVQQADELLKMAQEKIAELEQDKAAQTTKGQFDLMKAEVQGMIQQALQELKGRQQMIEQNDQQAHETAMAAAEAAHEAEQAEKQAELAAEQAERGDVRKEMSADLQHRRSLQQGEQGHRHAVAQIKAKPKPKPGKK